MAPDGTVIDQHWVTWLTAPKGMAILGDELIVTDLHVIDVVTGERVGRLTGEGAEFLNDAAAVGNLDGVDRVGEEFILSDCISIEIFAIVADETTQSIH